MFPIFTKICISLFQTTVIPPAGVVYPVEANVLTKIQAMVHVVRGSNVTGSKRPRNRNPEKIAQKPETIAALTPRF